MIYTTCQTAAVGSSNPQTRVSKNVELRFGTYSTVVEVILGIVMMVGQAKILMDGQSGNVCPLQNQAWVLVV